MMMRWLVVLVLAFALMASAIPGIPADSLSFDPQPIAGPRIRAGNSNSLNWSGYAVETSLTSPASNVASDAKGQWVVPGVTCGRQNTYSAAWVGIDGYSSSTVEQIGTEHDCYKGQPRYYTWFEMYPKRGFLISSVPISANNTITAEVKYIGGSSGNDFLLSIGNVTTGKSFSTVQSLAAKRQSAEWIVEAPGVSTALANFGTLSFSNAQATLGANTGTINAFPNDKITMVDRQGRIRAQPSDLSGSGSSFSITWKSSR